MCKQPTCRRFESYRGSQSRVCKYRRDFNPKLSYAGMVELVDMRDLGSRVVRRTGSSPATGANRSVNTDYY